MDPQRDHFLVITYPAQGHINPALHLARRLARTTASSITFSTSLSAHRRMFPDSTHHDDDGLITYTPFSDGYDDGFDPSTHDYTHFLSQFNSVGPRSFSSLLDHLAARGRPVTCVIYTLMLSWAADVARDHGIPSALYWIQPATVFAIYYHYFHAHPQLSPSLLHNNDPSFRVKLPGLPPFQIKDLPSFLTTPNDPFSNILGSFKDTFDTLDRESEKPKVLMNTFDELEPDALSKSTDKKIESIAIGPPIEDGQDFSLFKSADEKAYVEFLNSKPEKSVVYVSFGSLSVIKKEQMEEISRGLRESGRPYLWVVRKDSRWEGVELGDIDGENNVGMVVEWCSQVRVLSHGSVGCFVTHCGWNSTVESLVCGVPTVGVPQWTDQRTNARLVEGEWKTGVRGEINGEGVLEGEELKRCLDLVMGDGEKAGEIRKNAAMWRDKAREAVSEGGSSDRNLRAFVQAVSTYV